VTSQLRLDFGPYLWSSTHQKDADSDSNAYAIVGNGDQGGKNMQGFARMRGFARILDWRSTVPIR
jgi:hypothetical protein